MDIRPIRPDEIETARQLLAANDWGKRVADAGVFAELIQRSQIALVALDEGQIVGFLRAITDGLFNGYISMVVVAGSHRGRGIGKALVQAAMGDKDDVTWVLAHQANLGNARLLQIRQ